MQENKVNFSIEILLGCRILGFCQIKKNSAPCRFFFGKLKNSATDFNAAAYLLCAPNLGQLRTLVF
jgi:hypothetical protein